MIAEQYVLQQLLSTSGCPVHYWSKDNSTAEIEFIAAPIIFAGGTMSSNQK